MNLHVGTKGLGNQQSDYSLVIMYNQVCDLVYGNSCAHANVLVRKLGSWHVACLWMCAWPHSSGR